MGLVERFRIIFLGADGRGGGGGLVGIFKRKIPKIGIRTPCESFTCTLNIARREKLHGQPSDWPVPDNTFVWLKSCRYTPLWGYSN